MHTFCPFATGLLAFLQACIHSSSSAPPATTSPCSRLAHAPPLILRTSKRVDNARELHQESGHRSRQQNGLGTPAGSPRHSCRVCRDRRLLFPPRRRQHSSPTATSANAAASRPAVAIVRALHSIRTLQAINRAVAAAHTAGGRCGVRTPGRPGVGLAHVAAQEPEQGAE
eukprot:scaffold12174_cov121-Isochrysis_galbana.AAC.5